MTEQSTAPQPATPSPDTKLLADLFREFFKETMGHERFFGTLRARIAWSPATIAMTLVSFFILQFKMFWFPYSVFSIILILIFATNIHLERAQRRCRYICRECAELVNAIANGNVVGFVNYGTIREIARGKMSEDIHILRHDTPTWTLLGFLLGLVALPLIVFEMAGGSAGLAALKTNTFQIQCQQGTNPTAPQGPQLQP